MTLSENDASSILCSFQGHGLHTQHTGIQPLMVMVFPVICLVRALNALRLMSVESQVSIHRLQRGVEIVTPEGLTVTGP